MKGYFTTSLFRRQFHFTNFTCPKIVNYIDSNSQFSIFMKLRGNCTSNQKISMFCALGPYLKITNTFLKNNICILKQIVLGTQKWH